MRAEVWPIVDLWFLTKRYGGPFGGTSLPCPGSPAEQPALLMDAMALLDSLETKRDG